MKNFPLAIHYNSLPSTFWGTHDSPTGQKNLLAESAHTSLLVQTSTFLAVTAKRVAKASVIHFVMAHGPPRFLLLNNGRKFTSWVFQYI